MKRRGFLEMFGMGAAASFVPFVVPESTKSVATYAAPLAAPVLAPTGKTWMFGSFYQNLCIQVAPKHAIQFHRGRYWTSDPEIAGAVRQALKGIRPGVHHGVVVGREIVTAQDVEWLQAAELGLREGRYRGEYEASDGD